MTIVGLILTLQILRILRTLLEAFVFLPSQCFILFLDSFLVTPPCIVSGWFLGQCMSSFQWEAGCAEHFIQCRALSRYRTPSVDKLAALCRPPGGIVGSHCYHSYRDFLADGMDPPGLFFLIAGILIGCLRVFRFYLEWKDQSLTISYRKYQGPNSALCIMCKLYKRQVRILCIWGRISTFKTVPVRNYFVLFYVAKIVLEVHYIINCLHLGFSFTRFSLQAL